MGITNNIPYFGKMSYIDFIRQCFHIYLCKILNISFWNIIANLIAINKLMWISRFLNFLISIGVKTNQKIMNLPSVVSGGTGVVVTVIKKQIQWFSYCLCDRTIQNNS